VNLVEVSVVIPSLNEARTIGECIEKIKTVFRQYNIDGEIIVADNSDEDDTPQIARSLGAKVVVPDKRGYGYAYLYAFKHVRGKYIVLGDADNTYDFLEMPRLLEPLMKDEADIVIGSRFKGEIKKGAMPWHHRYIGNPTLTGFLNLFYKAGVSDGHSGFRAIRRDALEKMKLRAHGMEFASEMIIEAVRRKLRIKEVPITYYPREASKSKLNSFSDGWRHLKFMLIYAPTYLYIIPGSTFCLIGALLMLFSYFRVYIGYTPGFHSMILGSLLVILGYEASLLGVFAKIYGAHFDLFDIDKVTKFILERISLEKGVAIGSAIFLAGVIYSLSLVAKWIGSGYTLLPLKGEDMIAFTLLVIGLQTIFNSFFLSMLSNWKRSGHNDEKVYC